GAAAGIDRLCAAQRHCTLGGGLFGRARTSPFQGRRGLCAGTCAARVALRFRAFGVSGVVLAVSLFILHMWLPARRRGFGTVWPGILATMVLWLICGFTFGHYLAEFAYTYVNYYAGLALIALVFLYYSAWIFVYGGELNAAIARVREAKA